MECEFHPEYIIKAYCVSLALVNVEGTCEGRNGQKSIKFIAYLNINRLHGMNTV